MPRMLHAFNKPAVPLKSALTAFCRESQLKYRFNQWGWKRKISASKKDKVADKLAARAGKESALTYKGRNLDLKKIQRHMRDQEKKQQQQLVLEPGSSEARTQHTTFSALSGVVGSRMYNFIIAQYSSVADFLQFPKLEYALWGIESLKKSAH